MLSIAFKPFHCNEAVLFFHGTTRTIMTVHVTACSIGQPTKKGKSLFSMKQSRKALVNCLNAPTFELGSGFMCNVSTIKEFNKISLYWMDSRMLTTTLMLSIVSYNSGRSDNSSAI